MEDDGKMELKRRTNSLLISPLQARLSKGPQGGSLLTFAGFPSFLIYLGVRFHTVLGWLDKIRSFNLLAFTEPAQPFSFESDR